MAMQETQSALIEGKVATILNVRELTINRGSQDGVEVGMRFKIVDENAAVIDPDTKEELGTISREKIRVKIVYVQPRFSIARTYDTYQAIEPIPNLARQIEELGMPLIARRTRTVTKVRTLASGSETPLESYDEGKGFVNVGDKAVQLE